VSLISILEIALVLLAMVGIIVGSGIRSDLRRAVALLQALNDELFHLRKSRILITGLAISVVAGLLFVTSYRGMASQIRTRQICSIVSPAGGYRAHCDSVTKASALRIG
jgi:hypothetical protein